MAANMVAIMSRGLRGRLRINEPMSRHTSWRVGGVADKFYVPADTDDLKEFLQRLDIDEPVTWIGLGSNLLVRDGGIRGTVIATKNMNDNMELLGPTEISAGAGTSCARVARFSTGEGLTGAEFLAGIPGTLGGALAMNAGAFGSETWDIITAVTVIDRSGQEFMRNRDDYTIGYRSVERDGQEWFVAATMQLRIGDADTHEDAIRELLRRRSESQPIGEPSCGSVFRNPDEGMAAAALIDACGLKGKKIGGAMVSEKHANFIINSDGASARDIEDLIHFVQQVVCERHGISLIPEVRVIGDEIEQE